MRSFPLDGALLCEGGLEEIHPDALLGNVRRRRIEPVESLVAGYETVQHAGGRLGFNFLSFEEAAPVPDEWNRRDFILAATLGGEYLPHPRLSVGAEVMLGFVSIGETEFTPGGGTTVKGGGGSATLTQGTVFVRVYLF